MLLIFVWTLVYHRVDLRAVTQSSIEEASSITINFGCMDVMGRKAVNVVQTVRERKKEEDCRCNVRGAGGKLWGSNTQVMVF